MWKLFAEWLYVQLGLSYVIPLLVLPVCGDNENP